MRGKVVLLPLLATATSTGAFVVVRPTPALSSITSRSRAATPPVRPLSALQVPRTIDLEERVQDVEYLTGSEPAALMEEETTRVTKKSGPTPKVVIDGDGLEDTNTHRAILAGHYAVTLLALSQVWQGIHGPFDAAVMAITTVACLIFSDFFSGLFHWSVDNYGDGSTPVFGSVIAAFQGHHDAPWTITYRPFANNVHKICKATIPLMLIATVLFHSIPAAILFWTLFANLQMLSQEFHKWSHMKEPPQLVMALQDTGIILNRKEHGAHHSSPFESNYCILTGMCNPFLDASGFWRRMEALVYRLTGAEPNTWKLDPAVKALALERQ